MARKKQITRRKTELVARLADARQSIDRRREVLREKFHLEKQLRRLLTYRPKAIFMGSIVTGLASTLLLRRSRKTPKPSKTTAQMLLAWCLAMLKPVAKAWLVARAKKIVLRQITGHSQKQKPVDTRK